MDKNPFSLYDFLGYVIPGGVTLIFVWFITHPPLHSLSDVFMIDESLISLVSLNNLVIIMTASYIIGHFMSYVSTLTIERFALWNYEYPSRYLMGEEKVKSKYFNKNIFCKWEKWHLIAWRLMLIAILLPISLLSLLLGRLLRLNSFVLKPLDPYLRNSVSHKYDILEKRLGLPMLSDSSEMNGDKADKLRIIYHYEYEKNERQSGKMDNYVALYGFLRSITLIFTLLFDYLLLNFIINFNKGAFDMLHYLILMASVGCVSYVFYLSFMKFYSRFTVECFMALITDETIIQKK